MLSFQIQICPGFLNNYPILIKAYKLFQSGILIYPFYHPHSCRETQTNLLPSISEPFFCFRGCHFCFLQHSLSLLRYFLSSSKISTQGSFLENLLPGTSACTILHHTPHTELDSIHCTYFPVIPWQHTFKLLVYPFLTLSQSPGMQEVLSKPPLQHCMCQWRLCRASEPWRKAWSRMIYYVLLARFSSDINRHSAQGLDSHCPALSISSLYLAWTLC